MEYGGRERSYYLAVPDSTDRSIAAPVLVLLHGSGTDGRSLLGLWQDFAASRGLLLVAPNALHSSAWRLHDDGPAFIRDVLDAVAAAHAINRRRVYLFGQSGGAVYALTLAMMESEYFAAGAVHAGAWRDDESFLATRLALRKMPLLLAVGDRDRFFSVQSVRRTATALEESGHVVTLNIMPRHGHSYAEVAAQLTPEIWNFLKPVALPTDPVFIAYDEARK
jgi:poly(3-hydroxybutyrate) depolymerase